MTPDILSPEAYDFGLLSEGRENWSNQNYGIAIQIELGPTYCDTP